MKSKLNLQDFIKRANFDYKESPTFSKYTKYFLFVGNMMNLSIIKMDYKEDLNDFIIARKNKRMVAPEKFMHYQNFKRIDFELVKERILTGKDFNYIYRIDHLSISQMNAFIWKMTGSTFRDESFKAIMSIEDYIKASSIYFSRYSAIFDMHEVFGYFAVFMTALKHIPDWENNPVEVASSMVIKEKFEDNLIKQ